MNGGPEEEDELVANWRSGAGGGLIGGAAAVGLTLLFGAAFYIVPRVEPLFPGLYLPEVQAFGRTFGGYRIADTRVFLWTSTPTRSVSREGQNLCWTSEGEKARPAELLDVDVDIDFISAKTSKMAHQPTPELFDEATKEPLTSETVTPPGPFYRRRCLKLAPSIQPNQPVQIRLVVYYQSITGLYSVPVRLPTIVFPASAGSLFAKHDTAPTPADSAVAGPKPSAPGLRSDADTLDDVRQGLADLEKAPPEAADAPIAERYPTRVDTTLSERDAERLEQSRRANSDKSRRAALRRLIPRALDDEDRDALGPYDPTKR
jgi:hypothetical protein